MQELRFISVKEIEEIPVKQKMDFYYKVTTSTDQNYEAHLTKTSQQQHGETPKIAKTGHSNRKKKNNCCALEK